MAVPPQPLAASPPQPAEAEPLLADASAALRMEIGPPSGVLAVGLCGALAFLGLYATQPLLPLFEDIFHASKAAVGLTVSASTLGVAVAAPFYGLFAERLSRKRVIVTSVLALAVPTLLAATAPGLHIFIFWRLLQGLVTPGVFAITVAYITEEWPRTSVAFVMGVYVSGTALGGFLGRIGCGLAASHMSWRAAFVLLGALTALGAAAVARWLPPGPRRAVHTPGLRAQFRPMLGHLRNPRLLATYAVGFNLLFTLVGIFTYITFYLDEPPFRLSTAELSYLFVVYLVGLVVTPAAGWIITRVGLRRGIASAILVALTGTLLTLSHSLPVVVLGLAMVCSGVFVSQTSSYSFLREASPQEGRVAAVGLYVSCYYLGGTAAGVVPSLFWHLGKWPACVAFIASLQLVTLTLAMIGWRGLPRPRQRA